MIVWILITALQLQVGGPYMAFKSSESCHEASARVPEVTHCIPFAADIDTASKPTQ